MKKGGIDRGRVAASRCVFCSFVLVVVFYPFPWPTLSPRAICSSVHSLLAPRARLVDTLSLSRRLFRSFAFFFTKINSELNY